MFYCHTLNRGANDTFPISAVSPSQTQSGVLWEEPDLEEPQHFMWKYFLSNGTEENIAAAAILVVELLG